MDEDTLRNIAANQHLVHYGFMVSENRFLSRRN